MIAIPMVVAMLVIIAAVMIVLSLVVTGVECRLVKTYWRGNQNVWGKVETTKEIIGVSQLLGLHLPGLFPKFTLVLVVMTCVVCI